MAGYEFVVRVKDPRTDGYEWTSEDISTGLSMFYTSHRNRGVQFEVLSRKELPEQQVLDLAV